MKNQLPEELMAGSSESPYGICTVVFSENKIYTLAFCEYEIFEKEYKNYFSGICLKTDNELSDKIIYSIFYEKREFEIELIGTEFQKNVWHELMKIPAGKTSTYKEIAININKPEAVRAVGNAVGANPVSFLVPCHRVLRSDGAMGGYRWGLAVKRLLLDVENIKL